MPCRLIITPSLQFPLPGAISFQSLHSGPHGLGRGWGCCSSVNRRPCLWRVHVKHIHSQWLLVSNDHQCLRDTLKEIHVCTCSYTYVYTQTTSTRTLKPTCTLTHKCHTHTVNIHVTHRHTCPAQTHATLYIHKNRHSNGV